MTVVLPLLLPPSRRAMNLLLLLLLLVVEVEVEVVVLSRWKKFLDAGGLGRGECEERLEPPPSRKYGCMRMRIEIEKRSFFSMGFF